MKIHTLLLAALFCVTSALSARAEGFSVPSISAADTPEVMVAKMIEASRSFLAATTCKTATGIDAECIDSRLKSFANEFKRQAWNHVEAPCPMVQAPLCADGKVLTSGGVDERGCPKAGVCTAPVLQTSCPMYHAPLCPPGQTPGPGTTDANNCPKPGACIAIPVTTPAVTAPSVPGFDREAITRRINEELERTREKLQNFSPPQYAPPGIRGGTLYPQEGISVTTPEARQAEEHLRKFAPLTGPLPGQVMEGLRTGQVPAGLSKESIRAGITSLTTIPGRYHGMNKGD